MSDPREITLAERGSSCDRSPVKGQPEDRSLKTRDRPGAEESDGYGRVLVRLDARRRVIVSRDDWQWILQRRREQRRGAPRWESRSFFRTRKQLLASLHTPQAPLDPAALAILQGLPEIFREGWHDRQDAAISSLGRPDSTLSRTGSHDRADQHDRIHQDVPRTV